MSRRFASQSLVVLSFALAGCSSTAERSTDASPDVASAPAQAPTAKPTPPPEASQFDFWVGEWEVVTTAGDKPAGRSRIEKILDGWVIQENWTSASASSGKSFNTYDPRTRRWRQHWVDDSGTVTDYVDGVFKDGSLRFEASSIDPDGSKKQRTMTFFDQGPDRVRQLGEVSADGGKTWQVEFDLTYRRLA